MECASASRQDQAGCCCELFDCGGCGGTFQSLAGGFQLFKGVISIDRCLPCVRRCLAYGLSLRDLKEMMPSIATERRSKPAISISPVCAATSNENRTPNSPSDRRSACVPAMLPPRPETPAAAMAPRKLPVAVSTPGKPSDAAAPVHNLYKLGARCSAIRAARDRRRRMRFRFEGVLDGV